MLKPMLLARRIGGVPATLSLRRMATGLAMSEAALTRAHPQPGTLEYWMLRYLEGDRAAFDQLYASLAPQLFGYLLRLSKRRDKAEDMLQITFAKLHKSRSSYLTGAPVLPWVFAIARRTFYDDRRYAKVRSEHLSADGTLPEPSTEEPRVSDDLSAALEHALDSLPEKYREAIQLTKISGLSIAEAALVLGATETAVKLRVHRGYSALRNALSSYSPKHDLK